MEEKREERERASLKAPVEDATVSDKVAEVERTKVAEERLVAEYAVQEIWH